MSALKLINLKISHISEEFVAWHNKEHSKLYSASGRVFSKANLISEFENGIKNKNLFQYLVRHKKDKENIGVIKIGPIDKVHMKSDLVAFIGNENYLKKGFGSEAIRLGNDIAFNKLNLRKIHGPIVKSNIGAVKVYLKANWIIEGIQKGHYLIKNKQEDAILVACFNPRYFKNKICRNSDYKIEDIYQL